MSRFAEHPVGHLRKVAMAYKKELGITAVGKMTKPELVMLLDKYLSLDEDHKISVKGKSSGSKDLEDILEGKKMEEGEKESKAHEKKEVHKGMEKKEDDKSMEKKVKEKNEVKKMVKIMKKKGVY
jgi:hypothetical protein